MKTANQRLQRLIESDVCQTKNAEEYIAELKSLAERKVDVGKLKRRSKFFKALSDEKRLKILSLLRVREMCVCELMIALDMTQPNLSHHLRILESEGIISRKKKGKWVYCSLTNKKIVENIVRADLPKK